MMYRIIVAKFNAFSATTCSTTLPHGIDIVPCGFLLSENKKNTEPSKFGLTSQNPTKNLVIIE